MAEIDALHIVALSIDARQKEGTPEHAKAVRLVEKAKKMWRAKFDPKRCPRCGLLKPKGAHA